MRHQGDPIPEDELPDGYPYDEMFPYSWVDIIRMFPSLEFVRGYLALVNTIMAAKRENPE